MSSRNAYMYIFSLSIVTALSSLSLYANPHFHIWTPHSNRSIGAVDLNHARQGITLLQDMLRGYRNGVSAGRYVTGYLPNHMDGVYLMRNAQLFVEPSHWQQARSKIEELDSLLMLQRTADVPATVDGICRILEDAKRDIDQRLECIAVHTKTSKYLKDPTSTAIHSPEHLNQLLRGYQQLKAKRDVQKAKRRAPGNADAAGNNNNQPQQPSASQEQEQSVIRRLRDAGLSSDQIQQLLALMEQAEQEPTTENVEKIIEFIETLTPAQQQAVTNLFGPEFKKMLTEAKDSQGFMGMIKRHPFVIGTLVLIAGAAIIWALFRTDDPGAAFGQKIRSAWNWIKSWVTGNTGNSSTVNPQPQPTNQQQNPDQQQRPNSQQQENRADNQGTGQHANNNNNNNNNNDTRNSNNVVNAKQQQSSQQVQEALQQKQEQQGQRQQDQQKQQKTNLEQHVDQKLNNCQQQQTQQQSNNIVPQVPPLVIDQQQQQQKQQKILQPQPLMKNAGVVVNMPNQSNMSQQPQESVVQPKQGLGSWFAEKTGLAKGLEAAKSTAREVAKKLNFYPETQKKQKVE